MPQLHGGCWVGVPCFTLNDAYFLLAAANVGDITVHICPTDRRPVRSVGIICLRTTNSNTWVVHVNIVYTGDTIFKRPQYDLPPPPHLG